MAVNHGVFEIEGIDDAMQAGGLAGGLPVNAGNLRPMGRLRGEEDEDNDIVIQEDYSRGPDFKAINASMLKDPTMEALELSERTVPGKGGKAGPSGKLSRRRGL